MLNLDLKWIYCAALLVIIPSGQITAQLSTSSLVVLRLGDGTSSLNANATAVSLLEVSSTGTLRSTINFNTTGEDAFTMRGNTSTNGQISRSQDGQHLFIAGFNANVGTANVESTSASTTNRVVARIGVDGSINVSTRLSDYSGAIRSAIGNGNTIYATGENGGRVTNFGSSGTSTSLYSGNTRAIGIFENQLYVSSGSSSTPLSRGIVRTDPSLPTSSATLSNVVSQTAAGQGLGQFVFLDRDSAVLGLDTIYAADTDAGTIDKYSFDGTSWTSRGTIAVSNIRGLTARIDGSNVEIFFATNSELRTLTDIATFNNDLTAASASSLLLSAGSNFEFRGVAFAPVPEPSAILALGSVGLGLIGLVRRQRTRLKNAR